MSRLSELLEELCPDGVEYRCFEDCCEYVRGITYNKSNEARNDSEPVWRVLRANNITLSSNTLNFDDVKLIEKTVRVKEDHFLTKGDILIWISPFCLSFRSCLCLSTGLDKSFE